MDTEPPTREKILANAKAEAEGLGYSFDEFVKLTLDKYRSPVTREELVSTLMNVRLAILNIEVAFYQMLNGHHDKMGPTLDELHTIGDDLKRQVEALTELEPKQ